MGALADERRQLGFTTWRAACRAGGMRLGTLIDFTLQLLPLALVGLLLGGLALLAIGCLLPRLRHADVFIAAHAGCALSLPVALLLCALLPPLWMLAADAALTTVVSWWLLMRLRTPSRVQAAHP